MRSLGGFRLRGEGLQRRVGGRTDYCNVQREGEGKGIEGIHVSLLRGGDGGSQHHPYFAMSHGVLRSPMGQHYKKENRIFGSPLTAHPPNYLFSSLLNRARTVSSSFINAGPLPGEPEQANGGGAARSEGGAPEDPAWLHLHRGGQGLRGGAARLARGGRDAWGAGLEGQQGR